MGKCIFIFVIYFTLFSIILFKFTRNLKLRINPLAWNVAFMFKLLVGTFYALSFKNLSPTADTWLYFQNGINIIDHHFSPNNNIVYKNLNILDSNSYFNQYRYLLMDYLSAFLSILSGKSYYINLIFYNFLVLLGIIKLYQATLKIDIRYEYIFFIILCFFPPFVFWTSGYHRDGLCIATLGIYLFYFQQFLSNHHWKPLVFSLIAICLLLFMRSFWGFSAFIVGLLWFLSAKLNNSKPFWVFSLGALFLIGLFILSAFAPPNLNFAQSLVYKQHAFLDLQGSSELPITKLALNVKAYCKALLDGFNHLTVRPYPDEIGTLFYLLAFLENFLIWILIGLACYFAFKGKNRRVFSKPENNVLLFLVIISYAVIGLTVPFLGAIVRYKAPFELLLILLLVQFIPLKFLCKLCPKRFKSAI